jgi:hypothetical protein
MYRSDCTRECQGSVSHMVLLGHSLMGEYCNRTTLAETVFILEIWQRWWLSPDWNVGFGLPGKEGTKVYTWRQGFREGESLARPRTGWLSVKVKKRESKILSVHQNLAMLLSFCTWVRSTSRSLRNTLSWEKEFQVLEWVSGYNKDLKLATTEANCFIASNCVIPPENTKTCQILQAGKIL